MLEYNEIVKRISRLRRVTGKVMDEVQALALATMEHAQSCGDTTLASKLFDAMGAGLSRAALAAYISAYFPVEVKPARRETKDTFTVNGKAYAVYVRKDWNAPETVWNFDAARGVMWYEAKAEASVTAFDPMKLLASFVKRAVKASEAGTLKAAWTDADTKLVKSVGKLIGQDVDFTPTFGPEPATEGQSA